MSKRPVRRTLFVQPSHTMSGSILTPITNEEVWKALTTFSMFTQPPTLGIALTEFVEQDVKGRRQECREMVKFLRRDEDYSEKDWLRLSAEFDYILLTMEKEERQDGSHQHTYKASPANQDAKVRKWHLVDAQEMELDDALDVAHHTSTNDKFETIHNIETASGQQLQMKTKLCMPDDCKQIPSFASKYTPYSNPRHVSDCKRRIRNHIKDLSATTNAFGYSFIMDSEYPKMSQVRRLQFTSLACDPMFKLGRALVEAGMRMIPDEFDRGNSALNHDYRTARRMAIAATQFEKRFEEAWSTAREKVSVSENPIMQKWHANALAAKSKHSGIHSSAFSDNAAKYEEAMGGLIIDLKAANDLGTDVPQLTPQEPHQNLELALVIRVFEIIHKGSESNYESKPDSHAHHDELESLAMLKVLDRFLVGPNEDIKLQQSPWTHPLLMNCVGQQMWVHLVKYFYLWEWNNFSDSTIRKTVSTDIPRGLLVGKQEKSAEKIRMWHMPNKIVRELVSSYRNLLKDILLKAMETDVLGDVVVDFLVGVAVARDMEEVLRQRSSKRVELIQAGILKCPMDHFEEALEENTLLEKVDKKQQAQELTESELEKMQLSLADEEYHGVILHQWESLK